MSQNTILFLQSLLIFAQTANAGIATMTRNPLVPLLVGGFVGSLQYFVQHVGNQSTPPPK